jgi:hypothetical protein
MQKIITICAQLMAIENTKRVIMESNAKETFQDIRMRQEKINFKFWEIEKTKAMINRAQTEI